MSKIEYRVRPVIRYVVTRFFQDERGASSNVIGEFDSETWAERVKDACEYTDGRVDARCEYVVVRAEFDAPTEAMYAYGIAEAKDMARKMAASSGKEWRYFRRETSDPETDVSP